MFGLQPGSLAELISMAAGEGGRGREGRERRERDIEREGCNDVCITIIIN